MSDWLLVDLACSADLARWIGARRVRSGSVLQADTIKVSDDEGQEWHWEIRPELLVFCDEATALDELPECHETTAEASWTVRAHSRHNTDVLGTLSGGGEVIDCLVEDLSLGGAKIISAERLSIGECLKLSIPELRFAVAVRVAWTTDDAAGVAFYGPPMISERHAKLP